MADIIIDSANVPRKLVVIDSTGVSPTPPPPPPVEDRFVDLGLPSGNLWAKYNLGVNPDDLTEGENWYGIRHSWAVSDDESSKSSFSWSNYKWAGRDNEHFTKYTSNKDMAESGTADGKYIIEQADDCMYAEYGAGAQVPSLDDWKELYQNCNGLDIPNYNGIMGLRVLKLTSNINGAELLLPMCNYGAKSLEYQLYNYPSNEKPNLAKSDYDDEYRAFTFCAYANGALDDYDYNSFVRYGGHYYRGVKKQ